MTLRLKLNVIILHCDVGTDQTYLSQAHVQTDPGANSLLYNGYRVFPGGKAAGKWRWPATPSSAEVKGRVDIYIYSLSGPLWPVLGKTLPLQYKNLMESRSESLESLYASHMDGWTDIHTGKVNLVGRVAQSVKRLATGWTVRGSNPGGGEIFRTCPDRPWGPPSLLYNGYRFFPGGKERPGAWRWPLTPSSAVVKKEQSYTSTPPMGRTACTEPQCLYKGDLYFF